MATRQDNLCQSNGLQVFDLNTGAQLLLNVVERHPVETSRSSAVMKLEREKVASTFLQLSPVTLQFSKSISHLYLCQIWHTKPKLNLRLVALLLLLAGVKFSRFKRFASSHHQTMKNCIYRKNYFFDVPGILVQFWKTRLNRFNSKQLVPIAEFRTNLQYC